MKNQTQIVNYDVKDSFDSTKYLDLLDNFNYRKNITRLRILSNRLRIETGRYFKTDRQNRLCIKKYTLSRR